MWVEQNEQIDLFGSWNNLCGLDLPPGLTVILISHDLVDGNVCDINVTAVNFKPIDHLFDRIVYWFYGKNAANIVLKVESIASPSFRL